MERGDLAAVVLAIALVILLTFLFTPPARPSPQAREPVPTTRAPVTFPTPAPTPVPETTAEPTPGPTPLPQVTTTRITYTHDYYLLPIRYLPANMAIYGFSDVEWQYNRSVAFAYIEENHGGITETFIVPYPVWRMTSTLSATRTPERARFRMILVDETSGQILEGVDIRYPGTVTKTVVIRERPLYMVIEAANVDRFVITLETPPEFLQ